MPFAPATTTTDEGSRGDDGNTSTTMGGTPRTVDELPPEAIDLATRLFEAARQGDPEGLLRAALQQGLGANMTNYKGDSLVFLSLSLSLYYQK